MNEITRIHIAKVPYDIEIGAKKELETYINKLSRYANDVELLADIEIRITELLAERHVEKDDVISTQDVEAIREQLGDPEEFLGDGDISVGKDDDEGRPRRRFYRDLDTAIVGGVLSGMARYLDTNPLWTRLAFIILLFMSFGTAFLVYIILWVIVPAARTATERLEMTGKPVTLSSIKLLNDQVGTDDPVNRTAKVVQRTLIYVAASMMLFGAILSLIVTVGSVVANVYWRELIVDMSNLSGSPAWAVITAYALFVISGVLLTIMFAIFSKALFTRRWTKKTGIATAIIIMSGLLCFGSGLATFSYGQWQDRALLGNTQSVSRSSLPDTFAHVKNLTIDADNSSIVVVYIVDSRSRSELTSVKNTMKSTISVDGDSATIRLKTTDSRRAQYLQPLLQIYGPALSSISVKNGNVSYYNNQSTLSASAESGMLYIRGSYDSVIATTSDASATIDLAEASVKSLSASTQFGTIRAGVIKDLMITQPEACPAHTQGYFSASAVTSGAMMYNGASQTAKTITSSCGDIHIGEDTE